MQHAHENEIRRRPGGAIDTAHYARIGRALHGEGVRDAARGVMRLIGNGMKRMRHSHERAPEVTARPAPVFGAAE